MQHSNDRKKYKEIQEAKARNPRCCGHSYDTAAYLGGGTGCKLSSEFGYVSCDTSKCPNTTKWDFVDDGNGEFDINSALIDCAKRLNESIVCPYCRRKKDYTEHSDWCVLGAVVEACRENKDSKCEDTGLRFRVLLGLFWAERLLEKSPF